MTTTTQQGRDNARLIRQRPPIEYARIGMRVTYCSVQTGVRHDADAFAGEVRKLPRPSKPDLLLVRWPNAIRSYWCHRDNLREAQ